MNDEYGWLIPAWQPGAAREGRSVLPGVRAMATTRLGLPGASQAPYDSFNLATHVGDAPGDVAANRQGLRHLLPSEPLWLEQVHGIDVVCTDDFQPDVVASPPVADASFSRQPGRVCVVMTADCLPILLAAWDASVVAAVHAGWRGLAEGVIESAVAAMGVPPTELMAWIGPAIGAGAFEVGEDVRAAFCRQDVQAAQAFAAKGADKWFCDLVWLARRRMSRLGISPSAMTGGSWCTFTDARHFYSYRREGRTGRMATMIWIDA